VAEYSEHWLALLPDGRIFGQKTQNRPQKNAHGRKKLKAVKLQNVDKNDRYRKIFLPCIFLDFSLGIGKKCAAILNFLLLYTVFSVVAEYFQIFWLLWPESSETIWQQCWLALGSVV
jgi:hypothetical protein